MGSRHRCEARAVPGWRERGNADVSGVLHGRLLPTAGVGRTETEEGVHGAVFEGVGVTQGF